MIFSQFYIDLMNRLLEIKEGNACKVKHIDLWNNQTTQDGEEDEDDVFPTPAVFIEYLPADMQTLGNRKQATELDFILHIVSEVMTEHSSRETPGIRSNALAHLILCDQVFERMQNFIGEYFGAVSRIGFTMDHNHTNMYEHSQKFRVRITDEAAMHKLQRFNNPDLVINTTLHRLLGDFNQDYNNDYNNL